MLRYTHTHIHIHTEHLFICRHGCMRTFCFRMTSSKVLLVARAASSSSVSFCVTMFMLIYMSVCMLTYLRVCMITYTMICMYA
jgi:hypothetical protein